MSFLKMKETFETKAAIAGAPLFSSRNHLWKCTLLEKQGKHWKHVSEIPPFIFLVLFSFVKGLQSEEHLFMKNGSVSIAAVSFSAFSHPLPPASGEPKHYSSFATMVSVRTSRPEATRRNRTVSSLELPHSPSTENFHYLAWKTTGKLHSQD